MAKKAALTPASIDALTKGRWADLLTPGLSIEVLGSGKKRWKYRRQVAGADLVTVLFGQLYPAQPLLRQAVGERDFNLHVLSGIEA